MVALLAAARARLRGGIEGGGPAAAKRGFAESSGALL